MLDKLEKIAKIISLLAMPIVLAMIGWWIQTSLTSNTIQQEYVRIAITILQSEKAANSDPLRPWATELLSKYSPVSFSGEQRKQLDTGSIRLPVAAQRKMVHFRGVSVGEGYPEEFKKAQNQPTFVIKGKVVKRVKYGEEKNGYDYSPDTNPCHDCAVLKGEYHLFGCEAEECPLCRRQVLSCGCEISIPMTTKEK